MNKLPPKKPNEEPSGLGSRRHRLPTEPSCPSLSKVRTLLEEAQNKRGTLIEMPWPDSDHKSFILTCQWDESLKDPVWTLYEEIDNNSKVVWTQPFAPQDLEFLYDILSMSAGSSAPLQIPDELKPRAEAESFGEPDMNANVGVASMAGGAGLAPSLAPSLPPMSPMSPMAPLAPLPGQTTAPAQSPPGYPQNPLYAQPQTTSYTNLPPSNPPAGTYQGMPSQYGQQQPQQQQQQQQQQGNTPYPYMQQPNMQQPNMQQPMQGQMPGQMQQQQMQQMQNMMPQGYPQQNNQYPPQNQMNYGQQQMPQQYPQQSPVYPQEMMETKIPLDYHLIDKRANILLGTMLKEAGLISEPTLEAALKLQELVREEKMSLDKAPEVLKRLHAMGSSIDQYLTKGDFDKGTSSTMGGGAARPAPAAAPASNKPAAPAQGQGRDLKGAFDILQKAQLLTESDLTTAMNVRKKHGGDIVQILEAAGKVNSKTVDAALTSLPLIREGLMKIEQVIMALNYCERMRVSFDDALEEMGWQNPRKLRTDLPL